MKLGRVIGTVVPCERYAGLTGVPMLVVQPLDRGGSANGQPLVAADSTKMAGPGELVLYEGGREAAMALNETFVPDRSEHHWHRRSRQFRGVALR